MLPRAAFRLSSNRRPRRRCRDPTNMASSDDDLTAQPIAIVTIGGVTGTVDPEPCAIPEYTVAIIEVAVVVMVTVLHGIVFIAMAFIAMILVGVAIATGCHRYRRGGFQHHRGERLCSHRTREPTHRPQSRHAAARAMAFDVCEPICGKFLDGGVQGAHSPKHSCASRGGTTGPWNPSRVVTPNTRGYVEATSKRKAPAGNPARGLANWKANGRRRSGNPHQSGRSITCA